MISVEEALQIISQSSKPSNSKRISLSDALGFVLSEDVRSSIAMPPFNQSAMDGYAMKWEDVKNGSAKLELVGEIPAGSGQSIDLKEGDCCRIFTGAPVPSSADVVIMQEECTAHGSKIEVARKEVPKGLNIRPKGEQIEQGDVALQSATLLNPGALGFLQTLGIQDVVVHPKPRVSLLQTGQELAQPGQTLKPGQVYESNSIMLRSALISKGYEVVHQAQVADEYQATKASIEKALEKSDMLLVTGGISVGDYDFVGKAFEEIGVEQLFYKVNQKPGKPLFYGRLGNKQVFGLPGNPAAALTCFYVYVLEALDRRSGSENPGLKRVKRKLTSSFRAKGNRSQILKASATENEVTLLGGQSSSMLKSTSDSNAFVYLSSNNLEVEAGAEVEVLLI